MTTTFDSVEIIHASKISGRASPLVRDTVLLSGKHSVQRNANYGQGWTYVGLGVWGDVAAILAKIGARGSLVCTEGTFTNCVISGDITYEETDDPGYYFYTVGFIQETA